MIEDHPVALVLAAFAGVVGCLAFDVGYDLARRPPQTIIVLPPGTTITMPPVRQL
jgi:hypothetical protein